MHCVRSASSIVFALSTVAACVAPDSEETGEASADDLLLVKLNSLHADRSFQPRIE